MNYYEFMKKACDEVVVQAENGLYYLEPAWRVILDSAGLDCDLVKDVTLRQDQLKEYLELQVIKLNTINDKKPAVIDWLHQTVTAVVEPAMLEEETEYVKNLTEYLQTKNKKIEV